MKPDAINLGANIRASRNKRKMSLTELSDKTGIAASNLSSIELGKSSPTLNTLVKIAAAFNMKAGMFLDEILYKKAVMRPKGAGETLPTDSDKVSARLLTSGIALNRMESVMVTLDPSAQMSPKNLGASDRFIYCLSGEITVLVEDETHVLSEGASVYIMPDVDARFENRGRSEATGLIVSLTDRF
jgi:quercetin dioxygenase-like cupin family protein/DNA-binding Xre family transcriptional regulator